MRPFNFLIIALFTVWLTSCATLTPKEQAPEQMAKNEKVGWDTRVQQLSSINSWDLKAKIAIRKANDAWSASLQWQQQNQNYHIALFGPLGSHHYEMTGRPGKVDLSAADGKKSSASTPEELLAKQVGWTFPVSNLYYWVRGIPVPNMPSEKRLDAYNHLVELRQQGWTIQFLRYTSVNNIDIPDKIFLDNPQLNVKIIINQWQL